ALREHAGFRRPGAVYVTGRIDIRPSLGSGVVDRSRNQSGVLRQAKLDDPLGTTPAFTPRPAVTAGFRACPQPSHDSADVEAPRPRALLAWTYRRSRRMITRGNPSSTEVVSAA